MSDFYFALARITAAQICRACGIDRCSRAVLDALTDVLIKYLMLLGSAAATALELRNDCDASAADVLLAASQFDAVRAPGPDGVDDIIDLMRWLKGPVQQRLVRVARPQRPGTSLLGAAQGAALAALPSSAAAAAAAAEGGNSEKPGQAGAARSAASTGGPTSAVPASAQAPTSGPTSGPAPGPAPAPATVPGAAGTAEPPSDWLKSVLNQQMLMGHRNKFKNTPFGSLLEIDPTIHGEPPQESADR